MPIRKPPSSESVPPLNVESRYSLPALLREVKQDRSSSAFAMEKLDQVSINVLFEQKRSLRDAKLGP